MSGAGKALISRGDVVSGDSRPMFRSRRTIPILLYHFIDDASAADESSRYLFVSPRRFRDQMRALKLLGYTGCSISQLKPYLRGERTGKVVGITFDDGYRNVFENALPVLEACGFAATVYAVSRRIGGYNEWDARTGIPRTACMGVAELRAWADLGHEVGGHTRDHVRLAATPAKEARDQIAGCKSDLEDVLGRRVDAFSYPYGSYNDDIIELTRSAGFWSSATTTRGRASQADDPLHLPRLTVRCSNGLPGFLWKVVA